MKCYALGVAVLIGALCLGFPSYAEEEEVGEKLQDTTQEFKAQDTQVKQQLARTGFFDNLQPFALGAKAATTADIKAALTMPNLGLGESGKRYDIVLQPGHYLRTKESGKPLGASGKDVSEQELVAFITANVAKHLIDNKINVLVVAADKYTPPLNTTIFLSIHADGSSSPCKSGPSLGYGKESSLLGMHGLAFALATSMGQTYEDFMKDNFTTNLSQYYMFSQVKLPEKGFAGVLEVGELSCPDDEKALIANALLIAKSVGVALKSQYEIIKEKLEW